MAGNSKRTIIQLESTAGTGLGTLLQRVRKDILVELSLENLILLLESMFFSRKLNKLNGILSFNYGF